MLLASPSAEMTLPSVNTDLLMFPATTPQEITIQNHRQTATLPLCISAIKHSGKYSQFYHKNREAPVSFSISSPFIRARERNIAWKSCFDPA